MQIRFLEIENRVVDEKYYVPHSKTLDLFSLATVAFPMNMKSSNAPSESWRKQYISDLGWHEPSPYSFASQPVCLHRLPPIKSVGKSERRHSTHMNRSSHKDALCQKVKQQKCCEEPPLLLAGIASFFPSKTTRYESLVL